MTGDWTQWAIIGLIVILLIWNISRRKKSGSVRLDGVMGILSDIDDNLKVLEERAANWQSKRKFKTGIWRMYKGKLDYLESSLVAKIDETFAIAEELNDRIESAKKNKMMSTLQDLPLDKLRGPLTESREKLIAWLKTSYEDETKNSPRRGCMGF